MSSALFPVYTSKEAGISYGSAGLQRSWQYWNWKSYLKKTVTLWSVDIEKQPLLVLTLMLALIWAEGWTKWHLIFNYSVLRKETVP